MRVDHSKSSSAQASEAGNAKQANRSGSAQEAKKNEKAANVEANQGAHSGVKTEISAKGKEFAAVKAAATEAPDVREDKIADLKRRIAEGSYKIDTNSVADRMVDDHLKMSGIG
jgi:negative regulator of flagellin synthesis FlgM